MNLGKKSEAAGAAARLARRGDAAVSRVCPSRTAEQGRAPAARVRAVALPAVAGRGALASVLRTRAIVAAASARLPQQMPAATHRSVVLTSSV